jgi:hypothetical protein
MIRRSGHRQVKHFLGLIFWWREGFKGLYYQPLRVFDLTENEADIHGGLLGVALASAVDAMLADQREGIGQDIEGGCEPPSYRAQLKLIALAGFVIVLQHGQVP